MTDDHSIAIDDLLESILRGAAKTLGCNSANLVVFNELRQEVQIRVGLILERRHELEQIEPYLGGDVNAFVFAFERATRTELHRAWRERTVIEVPSLSELARGAFPEEMLRLADQLIGDRRFLNVPVLGEVHCHGVIIFEKGGTQPFSPQQRGVLIQYANRIGEIIENESYALPLAAPRPAGWTERLVLDSAGQIVGRGAAAADETTLPDGLIQALAARAVEPSARPDGSPVRTHLAWPPTDGSSGTSRSPRYEAQIDRILLHGTPHVICEVRRRESQPVRSIQDHLLQIALEKSAPALLLDPGLRITSCNAATSALLGYAPEELLGQPVGRLFQDDADIRTVLSYPFLLVSHGHHQETAVIRKRGGELLTAKIEALLLVDEGNQVIGYLVLIREQAPPDEVGPWEHGGDRLLRRERLASMGEIAAQLAHEIRNPILAIGATLESLQQETAGPGSDRSVLASLSREVQRLDRILRDYLALSARQNATVRRVKLSEVVREAAELLAGQQLVNHKHIRPEIPVEVALQADHDGLKQVFVNLFINALEASPPGGDVRCHAEVTDQEIRVFVDDSGPGLRAAPQLCLTPFFSTKPNGTGLGLTVCRNLLAAHSGSVALANREQGGCRATVTLPRSAR